MKVKTFILTFLMMTCPFLFGHISDGITSGGDLGASTPNGVSNTSTETVVLFSDNFDDGNLDGWTRIDANEDGNNWEIHENGYIYSKSYVDGTITTKDYIVTTDAYQISESSVLTFKVGPTHTAYNKNKYDVVVSENNIDFTIIYSEDFGDNNIQEDVERSVNLTSYAGKTLHIGFLHHMSVKEGNSDGIKIDDVELTGSTEPAAPVAKIGEVEYTTLQAAFDAVKDGETITLIDNVTVSVATAAYNDGTYVDGVRYTGDKSFTVDFNGKTVTDDGCVNDYLIYINNKGDKASEITFTNGTIVSANGCWSAVCVNSSTATQNVVLNLNGMNITNSNDDEYSGNPVVRVRTLATVNVNDGTIITSNGASYGVAANTDGSTLNINEGATIVQQNSGTTGGNSVFAAVGGKGVINIKGGTITSDRYGVHTMTTGTPVINISGGTITAPVALRSSTNGGNGELATINVTGGTINGTLETYTENGKIVVSGGTFSEAVAEEYCADGFVPVENADGTYGVELAPVAKIGETTYATFAEAAAAAQAGDEIKLLANIEGDITVPANVTLNGNGFAISGGIFAEGDITFAGVTTAADFDANVVNTAVNIPAGASLQLKGSARLVIGHGATFNITGTIEDAKTADKATLVPSLKIAAGASITGNGVTFNVNNAYIVAEKYCSSKNSNANSTFDFNIENSIWEQYGSLVFSEPTNGMDPTVNFELKNSVLNSTSHLVFSVTKGEVVIDNSNVNVDNPQQIENRSTMIVKNGSVVNGAVATSSNAKNPGTIIVEGATYAVTGEFSGSDLGTGTLIMKNGASFTAGSITKANIQIDATDMTIDDEINLTADLANHAGTLEVINNDNLDAKIIDGKIVLVEKPVAKIGETEFATLQAAIDAAKDGEEIDLLKSVELTSTLLLTKNNILDGNGFRLTPAEDFTYDGNNAVIVLAANMSGYEANRTYTVKNLIIAEFSTPSRIVRANFCNATIQNCSFVNNNSESIITSAYAVLNVEDNTFTDNTASFAVINVGSDVSDGTALVAEITGNKFYNNEAATAGIFLASSADVTDNHFKNNTHTGANANAAAILAGPYTGNMAYTVNIKSNAFENAMSKDGTALPSVFAEDWSSYGSTTSFDLSLNYWDGNEPVAGTAYKTSGDNPQVTVKSYYETYTDGTLGGLVEYPQGDKPHAYVSETTIWGQTWTNAKESYVIKVLNAENEVMGTSALNTNLDVTMDGDVEVTWHITLPGITDEDQYWIQEWIAQPNVNNMPAKVELWVDGDKVNEGPVQFNGPDGINKIYAATADAEGKLIRFYNSIETIVNNEANVNVVLVRDVTGSFETFQNVTLYSGVEGGASITNTYSDDYTNFNKVIVKNGVTLNMNNVFSTTAESVNTIEGTMNVVGVYYHSSDAKTEIKNGGKVTTGGMTIVRYNNNPGSGIYIYGDGDDTTVEFSCQGDAIGAYSGTFYAEDAVVETKDLRLDFKKDNSEESDDYAQINAKFVDTKLSVSSQLRLYKDAALTLNGATVTADMVQIRENATPTINIDNSTIKANSVQNLSGATWNAVMDEDGYVTFVRTGLAGGGTEENPYLINNLEDLVFFRDQVNAGNTYTGKYIKVTATEIDLNNEEWTPIAYMGKKFIGNFDGNNVTVKNLKITKALTNSAENNGIGFFGRTDSPATIENIIIENVDITGSLYVGAIVGHGYTGKHVKGCTVKGNIAIDAWWYAGVIGGNGYMNLIDDCHVIGNDGSYIKGNDGSYIGGIWGFRGEGNNKITNCTVENLDIIGVDRVGGICGIGHYGNTISGCDAEDVTVTATDPEATTIGLLVGATQGNDISGQGPTIFENNDASDITAQIDNGDGTYTEVTNLYGTNIDGSVAVTNYVAQIVGGTQYATLAEAVAAAVNNDEITLLPTNAPIAMNASLYGKDVTITGTATVDWSKGWFFVGRGGEGNATVTFDGANLTSDPTNENNGYGIHVSGREKNTDNKYDGTLVIKNSTIELDYLIDRGTITLDEGANLTVKNGFGIAGRPASETESGENATATISLENGAKLIVNNHNGMGVGQAAIDPEGYGIMNINSGSTFETTQSFLVTANGTMNVNGGNVKTVGTLTNSGTINVTGVSTLNIEKLEGSSIDLNEGAIVKNSTVGGAAYVAGNVLFRGDNTFAMITDYGDYYSSTTPSMWTVEAGASLTLTKTDRYGLGYGDKVTVYGEIEDEEALTARESLTDADASVNMYGGLVGMTNSASPDANNVFKAEDAYLIFGVNGDKSFGNKAGDYYGNYDIDFTNCVVTANGFKFYEDKGNSDVYFKSSDLLVNGILMTNDASSNFTFENSVVLSMATSNGTDDKNQNAGVMTLTNTTMTYSAAFTNVGTLNIGESSTFTAPSVLNNGTINFTALSAKLATPTEGLTIVDKVNDPDYAIAYLDGTYQYAKYVAQIGEAKYLTLQEAIDEVAEGETITLLVDVNVTTPAYGQNALNHARAINFTLDLNDKTLSANTGNSVFRFNIAGSGATEDVTVTIKNGTVVSGEDTWTTLMNSGISADVRAVMNLEDLVIENYKGGDFSVKAWANGVVNAKGVTINSTYGGGFYAFGGEITLDNCTVNQVGLWTSPYMSMAVAVSNGGKMTVNSGTYSAVPKKVADGSNQGTSHGSWTGGVMSSGGTLIINDGTFSNGNIGGTATYPRELFIVGADADYGDNVNGQVIINGGTFTSIGDFIHCETIWGSANDPANDYMPTMGVTITAGDFTAVAGKTIGGNNPIDNNNPVDVEISGGTYGANHAIYDSYLVVGNIVVDNEDGTYSVVEDQVAKIGDVTYKLLHEAFNAAQDGDGIVVLENIVLTEGITVAADKVVVLDLNGKTITGTPAEAKAFAVITNKGNLTITDGTETEGKIVCDHKLAGSTEYAVNTITNSGTLTIVAGTIQNTSTASNQIGYAIDNNSTTGNTILVIESGSKVTASGSGYYDGIRQFCNSETNENSVTIKGGEVSSLWLQNPSDGSGTQNTKDVKGSFAINGGTLNNLYLEPSTQFAGAITGGHVGNISRFQTAEGRDLEGFITGGTFSVDPSAYCAQGYSAKDNGDGTYSVIMTSGTQEIALALGWNWFSSYIDLSGETGLEKVQTALGDNGVQIKGKFNNNSSSYQDLGNGTSAWIGDFDLSTKQMYMINTSAAVTMEIEGYVVDREETTISLGAGWNWISYPLYETVDINEALANHNTAANGDAIKTLDKTSVYYSSLDKWIGDLTELTPGQGYMYKSANATSFVYSAGSSRSAKSDAVSENKFWKSNANKFANNMTVVAMLSIDGEIVNDNYEIAAFANGECRGSARPVYVEELDQHILFLTINGEDVQELTFKYYDVNYGTVYELNNRINYSNDAVLGSIDEPYMFNLGILNIEEATLSDINIYPNPTTTGKEINLEATCDKVEVFNALGVKVAEYNNVESIDAIETAGIYVIRVTIDGDARNCRLVVK